MQPLDKQEDISSRSNRLVSFTELVQNVWNLGLITFGGPMSHIAVFKQVFIENMKCIDQNRFTELLTICQSLPGPTSTQLLISLSIYTTASIFGGFIAFLIFSAPTFIVMFLAGLYMHDVTIDSTVGNILKGFRVVSVAIILQAFWGLSSKYRLQSNSVFLFIISALTYRMFPSTYTIILLFILGGLYSFYFPFENENIRQQTQKQLDSDSQSRFTGSAFGTKNIVLFVTFLMLSLILGKLFPENRIIQTLSIFYRIGSIVIGGGHVILPMMLSQFAPLNYFSQEAYWNGFSIISCMPGPMFNLSVYVGTLITPNIFGAVASFVGLYTPCFLFILFTLPHWQTYRKDVKIKRFINGMCCVSVGLILTASIILWENSCWIAENKVKSYFLSLIVLACFILLEKLKFNIVLVLVLGQLLYLIFYTIL